MADIQTQDGIILRNVPDGTSEDDIKLRLAGIRAERDGPPTPQPEPQPPRTAMQSLGVGTRNVIQGAMAIPALAIDAANLPVQGIIAGARQLGANVPYLTPGASIISKSLTALGLPELRPEEKTQSAIMEGAAGVIGPGLLAKAAPYAE